MCLLYVIFLLITFIYLYNAVINKKLNLNPIKTDEDYREALNRLEVIFDAQLNTAESNELEVLAILINNYEKIHFPME